MNADKLFETGFLQKLKNNPRDLLREMGVEPTPEMLATIEEFDVDALKELAQVLSAGSDRYGPATP